VVPFAAGSGTDSIARIIGQQLSVALKQSVVIEKQSGASGVLAATTVARSAPDGYTLLMATNSTHSANPFLFKSLSYDPVKDFAPVAPRRSYVFMRVVKRTCRPRRWASSSPMRKTIPASLLCQRQHHGIVAGETLKSRAGIDVLQVALQEHAAGAQRRDRRARLDDVHRSRAGAGTVRAGTLRAARG